MSYVELKHLNEEGPVDLAAYTAAEFAKQGIKSVPGYGNVSIDVNDNGFFIHPADKLPGGLLGRLQTAWAESGHDVNAFYNSDIDGESVKSILGQMPSQQAFGVGAKLEGFPEGTAIPCKAWTGHGYKAIKYLPHNAEAVSTGTAGAPAPTTAPVDAGPENIGAIDGTYNGPVNDWWKFFTDPKFLMGTAAVAGIIALLKTLHNSIKIRFRKCAKVLYRMQKDFGGAENGMDMKAVLPGVGSRIMDWFAMLWGKKTGQGKNKGALGLRPFVDNYRNEIAADYDQAVRSYNMIASYKYEEHPDSSTSGALNNFEKPTAPESPATESVNVDTKVYESFEDALKTTTLNEGQQVNEALGTIFAAGSLALTGIRMFKGQFRMKTKDENGQYTEKSIAVTPKSTREICYAILNMYYGKYFNLEKVFNKMGIDDFADVDSSNVDKFQQIANRMAETSEGDSNTKNVKMYARVRKNYDLMVGSYIKIGRGVVDNFKKYTRKKKQDKGKDLGEKDANLLNAAYEKLNAELERQKDAYENNFPRVLNAITSSPEYAKFTDLVIKKVIPLFKTGLAGDADYVLDALPRVGDFFVVRQTGNQDSLGTKDTAKGNVAIVRVLDVKKEGQEGQQKVSISFARTALLKSAKDVKKIVRDNRLVYDLSNLAPENIDRTAFSNVRGKEADRSEGGDSITLPYGKWIALDPREVVNVPGDDRDPEDMKRTKLYRREFNVNGKDIVEYAYGESLVSESVAGASTQEFAEDVNLSEAGVKFKFTSEKGEESKGEEDPMNKDANIRNIVCVNISKEQEENLLSGNIQQLQFTGSYIELENACTALKFGEILTNPKNFNPNPGFEMLSGKVKEKDTSANLIRQQKGYTHVSHQKAANVEDIAPILNKIETRQTTTEKITDAIPAIAEDIKQINAAVERVKENAVFTPDSNPEAKGLKIPYSPSGTENDSTGLSQQVSNIQFKAGSVTAFHSGSMTYTCKDITDMNNNPVNIIIEIDLYIKKGEDGKPRMLSGKEFQDSWTANLPQKNDKSKYTIKDYLAKDGDQFFANNGIAFRLGWINHNDTRGITLAQDPRFSKWEDIASGKEAEALNELVQKFSEYLKYEPGRGGDAGKKQEQPIDASTQTTSVSTSFNITYSDMFNLAESFMGTLSYLNVHRFIKPEQKTKEQFYVLSENAWGDGVTINPVAKLNEFVDNTLKNCKEYNDFTRLAKSSVSINFMPITEDCSYKTVLPYNRYKMLTEVNPLYEATVILSFDMFGNVDKVINKGVTKICK